MELNIERRIDCRGFSCIFYHKNQEYLADVTFMDADNFLGHPYPYTECAIFKSVDRQLTFENAIPLYCKQDVDVSKETLSDCIHEFIENN